MINCFDFTRISIKNEVELALKDTYFRELKQKAKEYLPPSHEFGRMICFNSEPQDIVDKRITEKKKHIYLTKLKRLAIIAFVIMVFDTVLLICKFPNETKSTIWTSINTIVTIYFGKKE